MTIQTVVFDFDGTCTDIPFMNEAFLDAAFKFLKAEHWATEKEWDDAKAAVTTASPRAGWTSLGTAAAAPAAADPFILSGEMIAWIGRTRGLGLSALPNAYAAAYPKAIAPLRPELRPVLVELDRLGVGIHFVSNSATDKVAGRIRDLLADLPGLYGRIAIDGNAQKYVVDEPAWDAPALPGPLLAAWAKVPITAVAPKLERPLYLRRGPYMTVLSKVLQGKPENAASTLVVGDIWELDLALPSALGCPVHVIERASPYRTYEYERDAAAAVGAQISADLNGLLARVKSDGRHATVG